MRFEFCGKLDCPDWILAQLFHASKLDLARFGLICDRVCEKIFTKIGGKLEDEEDDEMDLFKRLNVYNQEHEMDPTFDIDDARACFGALECIMSGARLHRVASKQLRNELEQLGLAGEHCDVMCRALEGARGPADAST